MMSSNLLLRAAAKLRQTAAKATPGPWEDCSTGDDSVRPRWICGPETAPGDPWSRAEPLVVTEEHLHYGDVINADDVAWMALANPAIAEPLAKQLELLADLVPYWHEPYAAPFVPIMEAGIRTAQIILREMPSPTPLNG